ncbi:MAG: glycosyltransferase family 4 protein [Lentisphaerae bacterium]|nr:glycosyltransferase family 4 protein [Lentisphaerota bacterium]
MHTAQIIRRFNFHDWGGTENVVWNSALELLSLGVTSEILATAAGAKPGKTINSGIKIRRYPYFYPYWPLGSRQKQALDKKGGNPFAPGLRQRLEQVRYDLFHVHNSGRLAEMVQAVSRKQGVPYVISFHGGCFDIPEAEQKELIAPLRWTFPYGGILDRLLRRKRDCIAGAAGIISVGANEVPKLQELYPDKHIIHLPNGVNTRQFRKRVKYSWRHKLGLPPERRLYLCVSRIDYQKNQLLLLKMLSEQLRAGEDVHLLLIGPCTVSWYLEQLQEYCRVHNLSERVTIFPGLRPDDERLVAAYQEADLFFLPSLHEPFGIVVLEAWCAGRPVIAAAVGGLQYLVQDGETGLLFKSDDLSSLLQACQRVRQPGLAEYLARNAWLEVKNKYTWARISQRLANFYAEVLEQYHHH